MRTIRLRAPRSFGFAAVFSLTTLAVTTGAMAQDRSSTRPDRDRLLREEKGCSQLRDDAVRKDATPRDVWDPVNCAPSTDAAGRPPRPGPRGRPFVNVLMAVPLATYVGAQGPRASEVLTPADHFATSQLIGAGYVVTPRFRFGAMAIFNEVLTGLPPAADAWQFGGIAPIAIGTFDRFIIGGGPIIAYRSGGKYQSDVGGVVLLGASIPLGNGLALNIVMPVTALFQNRVTVSVSVAIGVAKVF